MKDLLSPKYPSSLVEKITGIDFITQRNWIAREIYGCGALIENALAGKARLFPLLAVYETKALARTKAAGLDLALFSSAMKFRIEQEGIPELRRQQPGVVITYWEGELLKAAHEKLFEFIEMPKSDPYFWIVTYSGEGGSRRVVNLEVTKQSKVPKGMKAASHVTFPITSIVASVDEALADNTDE